MVDVLTPSKRDQPDVRQQPVSKLRLSSILPVVPSEEHAADPLYSSGWYDPLDPALLTVFDKMRTLDTIIYNGHPLTTISFYYFQTVDYWWLILTHNGYVHPSEIPSGVDLKIPDVTEVLSELNSIKSMAGTIVQV